jgi:hypothetical protein
MRDESPRPTIARTSRLPEERLPRINSYVSILELCKYPGHQRRYVCVVPEISKHQARRFNHPKPPLPLHDPLPLPVFLASGLNFHTCMSKRLFLNGGENAHLFPVVSKLGTTVETHHIRSGERGSLAAALSWLAGLGKADSFMPAPEQSVKDLHKLLPAVASSTCF